MSVITELIRQEQDGTISFGNYEAASKQKLADFEVDGDLYYIKTYREITRVEKTGVCCWSRFLAAPSIILPMTGTG